MQEGALQVGALASEKQAVGARKGPAGGMHLFQLLGPGLLCLPKAIFGFFGLLKTSHHLLVKGLLLPVLDLLEVLIHQRGLHLQVQLAHLLCLGHDSHPGLLHRPVLRPWHRREAGGLLGTVGPRQALGEGISSVNLPQLLGWGFRPAGWLPG